VFVDAEGGRLHDALEGGFLRTSCDVLAIPSDWVAFLQADSTLVPPLLRCAQEALYERSYRSLLASQPPEKALTFRTVRARNDATRARIIASNPTLAAQEAQERAENAVFLIRFGPAPSTMLDLDATWDMLNYALTKAVQGDQSAVAAFLARGPPIGGKVADVRVHGPEGVQQIAEALAPLTGEQLVAQLDFAEMAQKRIYPILTPKPDAWDQQNWVRNVRDCGAALLAYVKTAAAEGQAILIAMDA
jgi:hypothetical protein